MISNKKLLVAGCSITHGHETVVGNYDIRNTQYSYAKYVADHLGAEYQNVSYPGASNEFIFHRAMEELASGNYTDCLVAWTSLHRDAWEKDSLKWTFNLNYGACTDISSTELPFVKTHKIAKFHSNVRERLNEVVSYWDTLRIRVLNDDLEKKLKHYRLAIKSVCDTKNVRLVEINALPNSEVLYTLSGSWLNRGVHPTKAEHRAMAEKLIESQYS